MRPIHWVIIWVMTLMFLLGILKPSLFALFIFRAWQTLGSLTSLALAFGLVFLGIRIIFFGR